MKMQELTGQPNPTEALRLFGEWTRGRFDVWMLAGSHNASNRAILLSQLTGARQTQAKSGVNALREAFYSAYNVTGDCLAAMQDDFISKAKAVQS